MRLIPRALSLSFFCLCHSLGYGQSDTLQVELSEIYIDATRSAETEVSAPFSVTLHSRPIAEIERNPAVTLDAVLNNVPGVWINNRENAALGERLTVRGMGWRAAFGVRGVQVLMDGIPLTSPDGQTVMTIIDPAFVRRVEVIRGPASSFWGNASGGTLFLTTDPTDEAPTVRLRQFEGAHAVQKTEVEAGGAIGRHRVSANASRLYQGGFREYSRTEIWRVGAHGHFLLSDRSHLRVVANYVDAPLMEHPGSLTAEEVRQNPAMANPSFVNTGSGKDSRQGQGGAALSQETTIGTLTVTGYGLFRELHNPLPFAYVFFDRLAGGARLALQNDRTPFRWGIGVDGALQRDDRKNWNNVQGTPGDDLRLDQLENVRTGAAFGRLAKDFGQFTLSGGVRYDQLHFHVEDRLGIGDDQSGSRLFSALSPTAGLTFVSGPGVYFANISTSFESPTTTELVNRPDMQGGFNPDIKPERTIGVEVGTRGALTGPGLFYDVALFRFRIEDRLVPFQTPEGGARTFYRNEGATLHSGLELLVSWYASASVRTSLGYAWSRFIFQDDENAGNHVPGTPPHRVFGDVGYRFPGGVETLVRVEGVSEYFVDSSNSNVNEGYLVADLQLAHEGIRLGSDFRVHPFIRINNITDTRYNSSVVVNAAADRFFEPAAGRVWHAGLNVTWR